MALKKRKAFATTLLSEWHLLVVFVSSSATHSTRTPTQSQRTFTSGWMLYKQCKFALFLKRFSTGNACERRTSMEEKTKELMAIMAKLCYLKHPVLLLNLQRALCGKT